jgi:hypothetical protein
MLLLDSPWWDLGARALGGSRGGGGLVRIRLALGLRSGGVVQPQRLHRVHLISKGGGEAVRGEVARGEVVRGEVARGEVARGEVARGEVAMVVANNNPSNIQAGGGGGEGRRVLAREGGWVLTPHDLSLAPMSGPFCSPPG